MKRIQRNNPYGNDYGCVMWNFSLSGAMEEMIYARKTMKQQARP